MKRTNRVVVSILVFAWLLVLLPAHAVVVSNFEVPSEEGPLVFSNVKIEGKGQEKGINIKWEAAARNRTGQDWYKVTFCVRAFDTQGQAIQPIDGSKCLVTMWAYHWANSGEMKWKGSNKIKVGDAGDRRIEVARFEVSAKEFRQDPESIEVFSWTCSQVWPVALRAFIDSKFQPTVSDKDTFLASFNYTGGQTENVLGGVNDVVKAYTTGKTGFWTTWHRFRIESANLTLRPEADVNCRAETRITFAGFQNRNGWYELMSNHQYEKGLLEKISAGLSGEYQDDLEHAISKLPTADDVDSPAKIPAGVKISFSSEPPMAEIEVDGEYVGNTPSTMTLDPGQHTITIKKIGFQGWERQMRFRDGDSRSIHAELPAAVQ